jgi:hypothetical protein
MSTNHIADLPVMLTTAQAAAALHRKPSTLNRWAFTNTGLVKPIHIGRRLAWPAAAILALLNGGENA